MKFIRIKKSTKQAIIVFVTIILVLVIGFFVVYQINVTQIKRSYEIRLEDAQNIISDNQRSVYVPIKKIKAGTIIKKDNVMVMEIASSLDPEIYMNKQDIGKKALITLNANVPIQKIMLTDPEITGSMREEEFAAILLNSNLKNNDIVDIRIAFPNGESFVVLSKKTLKNVSIENNICFLDLTAEELDRIQSAIVDASLHKANIYTVKYLKSSIQRKSIVNYTPAVEVIDLIKSDPNIIKIASDALKEQARLNLEVRLKAFRTATQNMEAEGTNPNDKVDGEDDLDTNDDTEDEVMDTSKSDKSENDEDFSDVGESEVGLVE